jgi:hypothetical protein
MAGDKLGKEYEKQNQTKNTPVFMAVPKFAKSLFLTDVNLSWNQKQRAWYSTGKIGVSHVQNTNVNGRMDGMVEIRYTDGSPIVNIYLEPSTDSWYFISYDDLKRLALSSAQDDFNTAIESKAKEGKEGTFFFAKAETYEKNKFLKNFKKNYLGIDVGEIVEEAPKTQEKDKKEQEEEGFGDEEKKPEPNKKTEEPAEEEEKDTKKKTTDEEPTTEEEQDTRKKTTDEEPTTEEEKDTRKKATDEELTTEEEKEKPKKKEKKKKKEESDEEPKKEDEPKKEEKKEDDGF